MAIAPLDAGPEDAGPVALGTGDCPVALAGFARGDPSTGFPDPSTAAAFRTRYHFVAFAGGAGPMICVLLQGIFHAAYSCHGEDNMLCRSSQLQNRSQDGGTDG